MSDWFGQFHFLRPWWLLACLALPLLWRVLNTLGADGDAWRKAVDAHLLEHLLVRSDETTTGRTPLRLAIAAWLLGTLALAGPAWERLPQPLFQNHAARVIALELAPSMLAQDVKPSRLDRARFKIADILQRSGDAQTALIGYAGDAFVVAPLTDDANTVANLVDALDPSVMPITGNNTAAAIDSGLKLIHQAGLNSGEIILVADSASSDAVAAVARARAAGVRVSVLGIGTAEGAPVALAQGGFLKDAAGKILLPRLDENTLAALANKGGGRYATFTSDAHDLDTMLISLQAETSGASSSPDAPDQATSPRFQDRGPWLLLLLLPFAALGFRRGWLMLLPLALCMRSQPAQAFSWDDLWQRADQQAQAQLDAGDAKQAQSLAHDPDLRGAAAYRAGDYVGAAQAFSEPSSADTQYNLGNALAKQGRYPEALAAYDEALKQAPQMADAAANRKAIDDWLKNQQKDKSQQNKQDQKSRDHKGHEQQQPGSDQAQNSDQGDQQEQKDQDAQKQDGKQQDGQKQDGQPQSDSEQGDKQDQSADSKQGKDKQSGKPSDSQQQAEDQQTAEQNSGAHDPAKDSQQQYQQAMDQAVKQDQDKNKPPQPVRLGALEKGGRDEKQQAVEQWLQRVPDDPGGLLRRKFQLEYQRRQNGGAQGDNP